MSVGGQSRGLRARASGIDDAELRDRDGGYARTRDGGAAVALVRRAARCSVPGACEVPVLRSQAPGTAPAPPGRANPTATKPSASSPSEPGGKLCGEL